MEVNSPPTKKKGGGGDERLRGRRRDSEPQGVHRESSREVLDPKWHHLPSLRCVSALQVLITSYEYGKRRSAQLFNSFTVCLPVLSWEINRESGYSLNIYKNKLWWILSRNTVHVMKTCMCSADTLIHTGRVHHPALILSARYWKPLCCKCFRIFGSYKRVSKDIYTWRPFLLTQKSWLSALWVGTIVLILRTVLANNISYD